MHFEKDILNTGLEVARKFNASAVVIITGEEFQDLEFPDDIPVIVAPKKYAFLIESSVDNLVEETDLDKLLGSEIIIKTLQLPPTVEYVSTLAYFKEGMREGLIIGLIILDSIKAILLVDFEKSRIYRVVEECRERVPIETIKAILKLAISISNRGREGQKVGTAFVIGDVDEVMKRSYQLILNPFEGQSEDVKDIKNPENWESIRELAQLDGVFVVDENGIIVAGGRYLSVSGKEVRMKKGLGSRHVACAAITRETQAIAVTVSESGGIVRIFKDGEELIEIESGML